MEQQQDLSRSRSACTVGTRYAVKVEQSIVRTMIQLGTSE